MFRIVGAELNDQRPVFWTAFLAFLPDAAAQRSEQDLAKELARAALRLRELRPLFQATGERLGTHKDYIRHVAKEAKRDKAAPGGGGDLSTPGGGGGDAGFHGEVDDEDLMGGILSTI